MPKYITRNSPGILIEKTGDEEAYSHATDDSIGGPAWKLDVGAECNRLLELADAIVAGHVHPLDHFKATAAGLANDLHSIVDRVATFEELQ
jgi:hypothetical protein